MKEKEEFPLFPELTEAGQKEAQALIDKFRDILKKEAKDAMENIMGDFYCDIVPYIESDSWTNFKNDMMDGFKNYDNKRIQGEYEFKEIRKSIFKEFKDEIIKDLNQDHLETIKSLEDQIEYMRKFDRY